MRYSKFNLAKVITFVAAMAILSASQAPGDISIKEFPDFLEDITIGGCTEQYIHALQKNALGIDENDHNWVDGFFKLNTTLKLKSNVEFKFGMVYSGTFGEDYYGIGNKDTNDFDTDDAYIKFKNIFGAPVDLTLGRQRIKVEQGFLMSEGNLDFSTALYSNAEKASPMAVRADINLDPVTLLAYWETIATDDTFKGFGKGDDIEASGLNAHIALGEGKNVYAGVIRWLGTLTDVSQQDLFTYYLGTDLGFGPINLKGEYAMQKGDNFDLANDWSATDQDARAYNLFLKYSMSQVTLKPWIEVGTMYRSGDDPTTPENEGFNAMTPAFNEWGKFVPGEILGGTLHFGGNNWVDYTAQIGIMPTKTSQIRLQYHKVMLTEDAGYSDDKLEEEYNLFLEFFPNGNLYWGVLIGVANPGTAHEEFMGMAPGSSETAIGIMPFVMYYF